MFPKMVGQSSKKNSKPTKKSTDYFDFENMKELKMVNMMVGHIVYHMKNMVHIHVPSATVCLILHKNLMHICHLNTRVRQKKIEMRGIVPGTKANTTN